jgi:glycosyltransferase involved in cell wall biosynthesis
MQDRELLKNVGYTEAHVIESVFTSGLKTQTEHITRLELGLQDDWFIMLVVGIRLDTEVTSEFMGMMENALEENMRVVFCGIFENYAECMESFPRLKEQSVYLGVCEDILSRVELCDLYINPTRRGGGTSCVEAMYKGLPVVTVNYGDVAVNAGEEFCVKDYNEMAEMIRKYAHDKAFYEDKSQRAKERSEVLLDTDGEFVKILQEMGEEKDGNKI